MEAKELRIGNIVNRNGEPVEIREIHNKTVRVYDHVLKLYHYKDFFKLDSLQLIPPTPSILEAAGFSKWNKEDDYWMDGRCEVVVDSNYNLYLFCETDGSKWFVSRIKSLHQLQNLYYALTGIELTINIYNSKTVEK